MNVLFIGDVNRGAQDVNIERLFRLFSPVFKEIDVTASMYISEVNKKVSISDWLEVWRESIDKNRVSEIANLDLSNTAIIGFEISDADIDYFSENKIPWVNFSIHPIRFLDDLYFDVTTSFDYDFSNHAASTGLIDFCVNKIKSSINSTSIKKEKTLAIFGQTPIDKSIYFDGEFKKLTSYLDKIDALARDYPRVIYRPHPNSTDESIDKIIIERYGTEVVPEKNFYKFLITESIDKCCAISSSVNTESPYFGVESVNLDDRARKYGVAVNYKSLLDDRDFWGNKFLNMGLCSNSFNISIAVPDNYLRDVYESWGYITKEQEIYTIINTKEREIYTTINNKEQEIYTTINNKEHGTYNTINNKEQEIYAKINGEEQEIYTEINNKEQGIYTTINNKEQEIYAKINGKEQGIYTTINNKEQEIYAKINNKDQEIYTAINSKERGIYTTIDNKEQGIYAKINSKEQEIYTAIDSKEQGVYAKINSKEQGIYTATNNKEQEIYTAINNKEQEIYTTTNNKEQEIYAVIKTIQDEISNLEERNNYYLIELERSEQHVNALLNSRSWIVTSPFRFIKRCFMKLFLFIQK